MKAKVSLKLDDRTAAEKVEYAKSIVIDMTGNSNFTTPNPSLAAVTTGANNLDSAITAAADGGKSKTLAQNTKETALDNLLTQLGAYVENIANGDETIIRSAGMDARVGKSAPQIPDAPINVSATTGTEEGEIELKWKGVKNARVYTVEISNDVSATAPTTGTTTTTPVDTRSFITWTLVDMVTKTKFMVTGLTSGTRYAFRIRCVGCAGKSNYSVKVIGKAL
jgi:fibronectin type III domain protein